VARAQRGLRALRGRALQLEKQALEALDRPPIVVFSWSKTASSTAYETLVRSHPRRPVYHLHGLDDDVEERQARHARAGTSLGIAPEGLRAVARLRPMAKAKDREMALVTLVREPIARSVSSFFQRHYASPVDMTAADPSPDDVAATVAELHELLPEMITSNDVWFDRQMVGVFDVDLFDAPFDPKAGFAHYRHGPVAQAVIRSDRFDELYRPAIEPIIGHGLGSVRHANVGRAKQYRAHRRATMQAFRLTTDEIDLALSTRVLQHYFSADERDELVRTWRSGVVTTA
jgi:hypothetical protein